jgi:hypothetical protein
MNPVSRTALWLACLSVTLTARGQAVISEFMADNKTTLADEDGAFSDWIEVFNAGTNTVNLQGWSLTQDPTHQARWPFPATNLMAKGFLVVFASGKNRAVPGAPLHTDFSLKASGEYLALLEPGGAVASEFAPTFPPQQPDLSYGVAQEVTTNSLVASGAPVRVMIPTDGTLGSTWTQPGFNDTGWISGTTGVGYETAVPGFAVWCYLANVGVCNLPAAEGVIANPSQQFAVYAENAAVVNYFNTGSSAHYGNDQTFPGLTIGPDQDNFVVQATATLHIPSPGNWTFGVNSDDGFSLTIGSFSLSYPDTRGPGDTLQTFNFPAAGDYALRLVFYECSGGSEVELFAAPGSYASWDATNFRLVGDLANGGLEVRAPAVSGGGGSLSYRPYLKTDVQAQMNGINASAYLRLPFSVASPTALQSLTLRMMYDDGFVAYLNGQAVSQRLAPGTPQWNSPATAAHPNADALRFEEINLSDRLGILRAGNNVLALQGLNQSASDADFLILPELVEYRIVNTTTNYFATASPGAPNGGGFLAFVADTRFDHDRGFYDAAFSLSITTATANATIVYTTDGSAPTLANGTTYSGPIPIGGTTVIRAAAFKDGFAPSPVDTHSFIFPADVIRQSPNGETPPGWPASWGQNVVDYGMDPQVVNDPAYSSEIVSDLKSIPSFSIVTELGNLFDPATGIYANASQDGSAWERPASLELIYPDGTKGFQINAGIRIRGGYSRSTGNPKHAFRFFFRQAYGTAKLHYPIFTSQGGTDVFDNFDLRTFENYSWSFEGDPRFIGLRDQWSRDTQLAQGHQAERGDFYHLYINGEYWGLYNTDERAEASYGAAYFGGNKEDYDVVKVDTTAGYTIMATDGNLAAWTRLWQAATNGFAGDAAYFQVQGLNVDGTPNPTYENLLDVDNLIDYMLVIFFTGNIDAPISAFLSNTNPNNMYAVRNRTGLLGGFRFFAHDSEHTLLHESSLGNNDELHRDRTGPFPAGDPTQQNATTALACSNPQYLFTRLTANAEFRLRVADHIQQQFFNGGVLTTEGCRARFLTRSNEIYGAVAGESARWGDSKTSPPRTRNVDWVREMNRVGGDYFGQRPGIVLGQFRAKGWYPAVAAPSFNQYGGLIPSGFQLTLTAPAGAIYYTWDGSDPRLRGGAVSPAAQVYSGPLTLAESAHVKARVLSGTAWSALIDASFYVIQNYTDVLVTEIMYHPPGTTNYASDAFEFVELKNVGGASRELSGVHFANGIDYTFPIGTFLDPGQFVVLASDPVAFGTRYPGVRVDGVFTNHLSNGGEAVTLVHASGTPIFSVTYNTRPPWPSTADGAGFSLVPVNANLNPDPNDPLNWRASTVIGGSPGADDPPSSVARILVNEALTHTDLPQLDSVELYNPNATDVDLGNWYLTDQRTMPQKFHIPGPAIIRAGGYRVFTESDWNADPASTNSFRLDSHGEEIYLFSADAAGNLTGYSDGFAFGAAQNGVTFGRYVNRVGDVQYPAQIANTLGGTNAGPRVGPAVINEIQYHPAPGDEAFVELKSVTNGPVKLYDPNAPTNTWRINGLGFSFPTNTEIPPQGLVVLAAGDPVAFRTRYGVPLTVPVFGPLGGALQNNGETLALQRPDSPDWDTNTGTYYVPYIDVDVVRYSDQAPWPTNADGLGPSLERLIASAYGNDPLNWRASPGPPSPGLDNTGNRAPVVQAGPDQSLTDTLFPVGLTLAGTASDDGLPNPPGALTVTWSQVSGPGLVEFDDPNQGTTSAWFPGVGSYVLRLSANDGVLQTSDDVTVNLERALSPVTLVPKGSVWKYLDNGSDQGTAWIAPGFNDGAWASGPAPLGYGDANGQLPATTNKFGPDPNNKYLTTYYRHAFTAPNAASVTNLLVSVQRDDGVVVYLNGTGIFTNNMPPGPFDYRTLASAIVSSADETAFYSQPVDPSLLVNGLNVLAGEVHQGGTNSSDIIFDLELSGSAYPPNQGPSVSAPAGQAIVLPSRATLAGAASDDGLPIPPGRLTFSWSTVTGPGRVTFGNSNALHTTAAFSSAGTYTLRLSASDGVSAASDTTTVTVSDTATSELRIESADWSGGTSPVLHLRFFAVTGRTYTVQYRDSLTSGGWTRLTDTPLQGEPGLVEVIDAQVLDSPTRYYRIVTPQQP